MIEIKTKLKKRVNKRFKTFLKYTKNQKISKKKAKTISDTKQEIIKSNNVYHKSLILYISITIYIVFIVSIYFYYN